jgi:hypothetical protein
MKLWLFCILSLTFASAKGQNGHIDGSVLTNLKAKLEICYERDEHYRLVLDSVQRKFHMGSKEYEDVIAFISIADSINQRELIPILEKYGWLGKSQVGDRANEAIFYVVHHSSLAIMIKYESLMKESVSKGESRAKHLEWLEDRIAHLQNKPQKGNSQKYSVQRKDGTFDFYTDIKEANEERRKEGIDTIVIPNR